MGKEAKPHSSEDIWHLGIEDLLGQPAEPARTTGTGPFVVVLRTSPAPITALSKRLPRFEPLQLYQLERHDAGRPQYRLCIGIIETELEADTLLAQVREHYPGARCETAMDDDRVAVARKTQLAAPPPVAERPVEPRRADPLPPRTATPAPTASATSSPPAAARPAAAPPESFRWNIDDLLPDLGARGVAPPPRQRPSAHASPTAPAASPKAASPSPPRTHAATSASAPASAGPHVAAASGSVSPPHRESPRPTAPPSAVQRPQGATPVGRPDEHRAHSVTNARPAVMQTPHAVARAAPGAVSPPALIPAQPATAGAERPRASLQPPASAASRPQPPALPASSPARATPPIAPAERDDGEIHCDPNAVTDQVAILNVVDTLEVTLDTELPQAKPAAVAAKVEAPPAAPESIEAEFLDIEILGPAIDPASIAEDTEQEIPSTDGDIIVEVREVLASPADSTPPTEAADEDELFEADSTEFTSELTSLSEDQPSSLELSEDVEPIARLELAEDAEPDAIVELDDALIEMSGERLEASEDALSIDPLEATTDAESIEAATETARIDPLEVTTEAQPVDPLEATTDAEPIELLEATADEEPLALLEATADVEPVELLEATADVEPIDVASNPERIDPLEVTTEAQPIDPLEATTEAQPLTLADPVLVRSIETSPQRTAAAVTARAAPPPSASADSSSSQTGTLERFVAKMGAMVESAEQCDAAPAEPPRQMTAAPPPAAAAAAGRGIASPMQTAAAPRTVAPQQATAPPQLSAGPPRTTSAPQFAAAAPQTVAAPSHRAAAPPQTVTPRAAAASPPTTAPARPVAPSPTAAAQPVRRVTPVVDSTQTIRALTPLELSDDQASRWFVIQLMLSEEPIDPAEVPNLDIFVEYRLYCVAGIDQDGIRHALRLGFFSSESAAQAVAGYLGTFFDSPCIKRISIAEHDRFEEGRIEAGKDVGATGVHAVIELSGPQPLPDRPTQAPAPVKTSDGDEREEPESTSLWSRLLSAGRR